MRGDRISRSLSNMHICQFFDHIQAPGYLLRISRELSLTRKESMSLDDATATLHSFLEETAVRGNASVVLFCA